MKAFAMVVAAASMACAAGSKQVQETSRAPQTAEEKAAAEQDKKDEAKLICNWERQTGSNIPEKVCRMREQTNEERQSTQPATPPPPSSVQTDKGG